MKSLVTMAASAVATATISLAQVAPAPPTPPAAPRAPRAVASTRIFTSGTYLGVGCAEIDSERAKALKLKEERGVEVKTIEQDSPAAKAGLKVGDVVLEYNGQRVEGYQQFQRMVQETPAGRQVHLTVSRDGNQQSLTATVENRKPGKFTLQNGSGKVYSFSLPDMPNFPNVWTMTPPDVPRPNMSWQSGMLGIECEPLNSQLADFFGVKAGVLIRSVGKNTPAEKGGLKAGDVITKVDGAAVSSPREVTTAVRGAKAKSSVPVVVIRNKQEMTINVNIESGKGAVKAAEAAADV